MVETPPGNHEVSVVEKSSLTKNLQSDQVFGVTSKQVDVYKVVAAPLVEKVLAGYICTVLAYAKTGTDKTFTMEGERHEDLASSWEMQVLSHSYKTSIPDFEIYFHYFFKGPCWHHFKNCLICLMRSESKRWSVHILCLLD